MAVEMKMPKLTEDMESGLLVNWLVEEDQEVETGEVIAEVETDKAALDLEAPEDGILREKKVVAGTEVPVDGTIAIIADAPASEPSAVEGEEPKKSQRKTEKSGRETVKETSKIADPEERIAPAARRLADKYDIDPSRIEGSGAEGRVVKADIEKAVEQGFGDKPEKNGESRTPHTIFSPRRLRAEKHQISKNQAAVGKNMSKSRREIPQLDLSVEVDAQPTSKVKEQLSELGYELDNNDFILAAVARALCDNPVYNSSYEGDHLQVYDRVDLAFVVAVESDLFTPVIERADRRSIFEIHSRKKELQDKLQAGKLGPESFRKATFTVYNLGRRGIDRFSAIINPPQVGILAAGRVRQQPVVKDGKCLPGQLLSLSLGSDHRAVNGTDAASFLTDIKNNLEKPLTLL